MNTGKVVEIRSCRSLPKVKIDVATRDVPVPRTKKVDRIRIIRLSIKGGTVQGVWRTYLAKSIFGTALEEVGKPLKIDKKLAEIYNGSFNIARKEGYGF